MNAWYLLLAWMKGVENSACTLVGTFGKRTGLPVYMAITVVGTYLRSGVKTRFLIVTWPLWGGAYAAGGCIEQHGRSRRRTPVAVPPWPQQTSVALLAASHRPSPLLLFQEKHRQHITPQTAPPNTPNTQTHNNGQDMHCLRDPGLPLCISVGLTLLHAYAHTPGIKRHVLHIHYRFINDTRLGRTWPARWWLVEFEKCQQIKWKRRYWLASCHLDCISQTFPKIPSKKKLKSWASYVTMSWLSWLMSFSAFDIFFF